MLHQFANAFSTMLGQKVRILYLYCEHLPSDFPFSGQTISSAILNTFNRRKTPIPPGTPEAFQSSFIQNPLKQAQWQAFVRKSSFVQVEKDFGKTIDFVKSFLLPPIESILKTKSFKMNWSAGGLWLDENTITKHMVK